MEILKASDLRIGNLVTDSSGFICEIREIRSGTAKVKYHSDKDIYCLKSFSEIFSIPLTEEWLLKFGFYVDFRDDLVVSFIHPKIDIDAINLYKLNNVFYFNTWENSLAPKSVHQLQNLFYALTGEELEMV